MKAILAWNARVRLNLIIRHGDFFGSKNLWDIPRLPPVPIGPWGPPVNIRDLTYCFHHGWGSLFLTGFFDRIFAGRFPMTVSVMGEAPTFSTHGRRLPMIKPLPVCRCAPRILTSESLALIPGSHPRVQRGKSTNG